MIPGLLPSPWLLLAAVLAVGGAWVHGYTSNDQADVVQSAWDAANARAQAARAQRIADVRAETERLRKEADADRRKQDAILQDRERRLVAALDELRQRPARRLPGDGVSAAPTPGPEVRGCTGAELYRDDAELLTRFAHRAQLARDERDACYAQYERAAEALKRYRGPAPPVD